MSHDADAAMAAVAAATGAAVSGTPAAGGLEAEIASLRREIEQHRVSTGLIADARGDQIKQEMARAAEALFDNLKSDSAKATVEVDRIRMDCATLRTDEASGQLGDTDCHVAVQVAHLAHRVRGTTRGKYLGYRRRPGPPE